MADPEIATRAPESDAASTTTSPAIPTPTLSEHCTTDRPTPAGKASTGELRKLGDVDVYVSKPSEYPHVPAKFLLLLTGGTGLKSVNNQIQADNFASEGYLVVMPDLFGGDPAPNTSATIEAGAELDPNTNSAGGSGPTESPSFLDQVKLKLVETAKSFTIDMWLARHTEEKVIPLLHKVIDAAKDEFADAISHGDGIYAVGYCFGGRYVLLLASERDPLQGGAGWGGAQKPVDEEAGKAKKGPYIKNGAVVHATMVSPDDFEGIKTVPLSLICVENDPMFPDEVRTKGEDYLSKNNVKHEVTVYPGVPHGFAVVGDYADATIKEAQGQAFEQILNWLKEH